MSARNRPTAYAWHKTSNHAWSDSAYLDLGPDRLAAIGLCVAMTAWSATHNRDGHVDRSAMLHIAIGLDTADRERLLDGLITIGKVATTDTGWTVLGYTDIQSTSEQRAAVSATRAEAGRRGGLRRAANAAKTSPDRPTDPEPAPAAQATLPTQQVRTLPPTPQPAPQLAPVPSIDDLIKTATLAVLPETPVAATQELTYIAERAIRSGATAQQSTDAVTAWALRRAAGEDLGIGVYKNILDDVRTGLPITAPKTLARTAPTYTDYGPDMNLDIYAAD
jgi:hypothetical protein